MDRLVLIDEHDDEYIYKFSTEKGTKFLFKLVKLYNRNQEVCGISIQYFERHQWNEITRRKSTNTKYCLDLAVSLLNALPEKESV